MAKNNNARVVASTQAEGPSLLERAQSAASTVTSNEGVKAAGKGLAIGAGAALAYIGVTKVMALATN
jgi:hypothetical protein